MPKIAHGESRQPRDKRSKKNSSAEQGSRTDGAHGLCSGWSDLRAELAARLVVERGFCLFLGCRGRDVRRVDQDDAGGDMKNEKGGGDDREQHVLARLGDLK